MGSDISENPSLGMFDAAAEPYAPLLAAMLRTAGYATAVIDLRGDVVASNIAWQASPAATEITTEGGHALAGHIRTALRATKRTRVAAAGQELEIVPVVGANVAVVRHRASDHASLDSEYILDAAGEGIYGLDREGRTTFVNHAATEMTGWTREELLGQRQHEILHHSHSDGTAYPRIECPITATLEDGEPRRVADEVFWRKDGTAFPVEYTTTPVRENGVVVGAVVVFRDVTEIRKEAARRAESEAKFRAIVDALPDTIIRISRDGVIRDIWAPEGFNVEIPRETADVHVPIRSVVGEEMAEVTLAALERAFASGGIERFEYVWNVAGERRVREARIAVLGPDEAIAVVRDITNERDAAQRLAESEERLAGLIDSSLDAVMAFRSVRDDSGSIIDFEWIYANRRCEAVVHRSVEELMGRRLLVEMPGNRSEGLFDDYVRVVTSGEPNVREFYYEHEGIEAYFLNTSVRFGDGFMVTFREVTEERLREEALRSSERLLAHAQAIAGMGSWQWDPQTGELEWSEHLCRIYGFEPGTPVSFESYIDAVVPEDRERITRAVTEVLETRQPFSYQERIRRADGEIRLLMSTGEVLEDDEGYITVVGVCHDITEAQAAEERLRLSERRLQSAQRIAHLGSWDYDLETRNVTLSAEMMRILGLDDEVVSFDRLLACIHEEDRARMQRELEQAVEFGSDFKFYYTVVRRGEERVVRAEGEIITGEAGRPKRIFATGHDVTEIHRAEEQIRESEQRFRQLAEQISDLVGLHDPDGRFVYVSPSSMRILGYEAHEMIGRRPQDFVHPDDLARAAHLVDADHAPADGPEESLIRMRHRDGSWRWLELVTTTITNDAGVVTSFQTSARDVTARVHAQQEAARSAAVLTQRNRELQDFAYVASHDLQEPLRKIRAFADLVLDDIGDDVAEDAHFYLTRIQDSAQRMSTLISDLLAFSRVSTRGKPYVEIDLNGLLDEVVSDIEYLLRDVEGTVEYRDLPTLKADRTQIRQLLQNLIGNGLKFRRSGVPAVVRVHADELIAPLHPGMDPEKVVEISVEDNGIGFDEKYLDRIFTPFQRLHSRAEYAGTGMGLAICRRIVERHGGTITATSTPGVGSRFTVCLPINRKSERTN